MSEIPTIEPFQFIRSTAFSERVQLANKLNEVIDVLNQIGTIDDLQTQIDASNSKISEIQSALAETDSDVTSLSNQINTLVSEVNGLLKEVVNEVVLDAPEYGQVRVKVIHEDDTETASNALQIPVIVDGGISLISGTTARSFKIRYITADGVTHTTNDFVIPEGGSGTDVTVTSVTILEGDTDNSFKFEVGLSDGSSIQSNSYPFPAASELTPATTSQLGGVKIGQNIKVTADGTISVDLSSYALKTEIPDVSDFVTSEDVAADYQPKGDYLTEIPIGGDSIGGVKNGGNVTINPDGTMNVTTAGGPKLKTSGDINDIITISGDTITIAKNFIIEYIYNDSEFLDMGSNQEIITSSVFVGKSNIIKGSAGEWNNAHLTIGKVMGIFGSGTTYPYACITLNDGNDGFMVGFFVGDGTTINPTSGFKPLTSENDVVFGSGANKYGWYRIYTFD